mmetsp:Transcript_54576/g.111373  ORF Transcript_54576/g.111373 Transcript_54576/m.111373 type:complete len:294 (+) Transcript_54576:132-1013(+)
MLRVPSAEKLQRSPSDEILQRQSSARSLLRADSCDFEHFLSFFSDSLSSDLPQDLSSPPAMQVLQSPVGSTHTLGQEWDSESDSVQVFVSFPTLTQNDETEPASAAHIPQSWLDDVNVHEQDDLNTLKDDPAQKYDSAQENEQMKEEDVEIAERTKRARKGQERWKGERSYFEKMWNDMGIAEYCPMFSVQLDHSKCTAKSQKTCFLIKLQIAAVHGIIQPDIDVTTSPYIWRGFLVLPGKDGEFKRLFMGEQENSGLKFKSFCNCFRRAGFVPEHRRWQAAFNGMESFKSFK